MDEVDSKQCAMQAGKVDEHVIHALAQEMMKLMKGNQTVDQSSGGQNSFTNFTGLVTTSSHSSICCAVTHNCSGSWIVDTRASDHMTFSYTNLTNISTLDKPIHVILPDASIKTVTKIGQVSLLPNLTLHNVLYVPDFKYNLLLVSKLLEDQSLYARFHSNTCLFQVLTTNLVVAVANKVAGLYRLDSVTASRSNNKPFISSANSSHAHNSNTSYAD